MVLFPEPSLEKKFLLIFIPLLGFLFTLSHHFARLLRLDFHVALPAFLNRFVCLILLFSLLRFRNFLLMTSRYRFRRTRIQILG